MTSRSINDNVVEVRKSNQYLGTIIASLGGFVLGVSLGWNSSAGLVLRNHLDATSTEIGLIGGILNLGVGVGAVLAPFVAAKYSRTSAMLATMPALAAGWTFICLAGQQVILLMIGRVICGISSGVFCVLTPVYVAEVADKKIRGRLLSFFQVFINLGILYAFLAAHVIDERETVWRYSSICGIACLSIAPAKLLPESPIYYLLRNEEINAEKSLRWYRGDTCDVQQEVSEIKRLIRMTQPKKAWLKLLKNRRVLRSLVACLGVVLSHQFSSVNVMIFYALTLFNTIGSGELTGTEQTLLVGGVQILASLVAAFFVDVLGRRILLVVSTLLMGLFLILLGYFFILRENDPENEDIYSWMSPAWIILFFGAFNIGLGPISWSLLGDALPFEIRLPVAAVVVGLGWLVSLISTLTFDDMIIALGATKAMWFSAGMCWLATLFCAIMVKDTAGKSLVELQEEHFSVESNRAIEET
ncbi:facilitated trehalose transporter Tret1 [Augochlora pura]